MRSQRVVDSVRQRVSVILRTHFLCSQGSLVRRASRRFVLTTTYMVSRRQGKRRRALSERGLQDTEARAHKEEKESKEDKPRADNRARNTEKAQGELSV